MVFLHFKHISEIGDMVGARTSHAIISALLTFALTIQTTNHPTFVLLSGDLEVSLYPCSWVPSLHHVYSAHCAVLSALVT